MGNRTIKEKSRPICWTPLRDGRDLVIVSGWPNGTAEIWTRETRVEISVKQAVKILLADLPPLDPIVPQSLAVAGEIQT
jgi:hypothetical protein